MEFWKKQGGDKKHSFHSYIESDFKKKSYTCILIILDLRLCSQFILLIYYSAFTRGFQVGKRLPDDDGTDATTK